MASKQRKRRLARLAPLLLSSAPMLYRFVNCELDARLYQLRRDGTPVAIEPRVFDVLLYLLHQRDRVVSKDELLGKWMSSSTHGLFSLTIASLDCPPVL
ncbi:MAG: hypothetical protein HOP18_00235 [Deltaproteobacteria bacterium]|nr:hypothetical protein [Deltaproteobacteria bacterium]